MIERVARPMMGSLFVVAGLDTFRNPGPRAETARPVIDRMLQAAPLPGLDAVTAVRANAALHVVAGTTLSLGVLPRLSALALAGSMVPTTIGGHRFWEIEDPLRRAQQRSHFSKNVAILGGLLMAATRPGSGRRRVSAARPRSPRPPRA